MEANKRAYGKQFIEVCKEHLYTLQIGIYFRKNSHLVHSVNKIIAAMLTNGLINYWESELMNAKYLKRQPASKEPKKLDFDQLAGGLFVLLLGLFLSALVFIIELFSMKIKCLKFLIHYPSFINQLL